MDLRTQEVKFEASEKEYKFGEKPQSIQIFKYVALFVCYK